MSYCRAGDGSDVYAYADMCGGYTTHATGNRHYNDSTPQAFLARLEGLRAEGLTVPQHAIDRITREIAEASQ